MVRTRSMPSSTSRHQEGDDRFESNMQEREEPQTVQETQAEIDPRDARIDRLSELVE